MNLQQAVAVNKRIMSLIASKHPGEDGMIALQGSGNLEGRYYQQLKKDVDKAEAALEHGGLAPNQDPSSYQVDVQ